ncbi:MAG: hypothetical protein ABIG84_07175 [archaeon]
MALGVIIAIVVLIVVALAVIVIVTGSVGNFGASTGDATEKAGLGIQCQTELINKCRDIKSGDTCTTCDTTICPTGVKCP